MIYGVNPGAITAENILADKTTGISKEISYPARSLQNQTRTSEISLYEGRTIDHWHELIKDLDPADSHAGTYVPGLIKILQDEAVGWQSRRQAALTLGRIGRPAQAAVPILIRQLQTDDLTMKLWSAKAMSYFGPTAAVATPELVEHLHANDSPLMLKLAAIEALSLIGPAHPETMPALLRVVAEPTQKSSLSVVSVSESEQDILAAAVCTSLTVYQAAAGPAIPTLIHQLQHENELVRLATTQSLGQLGPVAEPAGRALASVLLFGESEAVRDEAARSLARLGPNAVSMLESFLKDEDVGVRWRAVAAFRDVNQLPVDTVEAIRAALGDQEIVAIEAVETLLTHQALTSRSDQRTLASTQAISAAIHKAIELLSHPDRQVAIRAMRLLIQTNDITPGDVRQIESLRDSGDSRGAAMAEKVLEDRAAKR